MSDACLEPIETALSQAASPLATALRDLGAWAEGRATCLLLEHEDNGETLIADPRWSWGRDETLCNREHFALVDLRQEHGFRRLAVLVEPTGTEMRLDAQGCGMAVAALNVTEALAAIVAASEVRPDLRARVA